MKTLQYLLLPLLLVMLLNFSGYTQTSFPTMQMESANGEKVILPGDLKGKKSIVFFALTPKAEEVLEDWYEPVYTLFLDKSGINSMVYDCHVKLVMLFTGLGQAAADQVMANVRANMDDDFKHHLLFHQGNVKDELDLLGVKKKNDAYVFVLNEKGTVIFSDNGAYSEKKIDQIAELVELDF